MGTFNNVFGIFFFGEQPGHVAYNEMSQMVLHNSCGKCTSAFAALKTGKKPCIASFWLGSAQSYCDRTVF